MISDRSCVDVGREGEGLDLSGGHFGCFLSAGGVPRFGGSPVGAAIGVWIVSACAQQPAPPSWATAAARAQMLSPRRRAAVFAREQQLPSPASPAPSLTATNCRGASRGCGRQRRRVG